MSDASAAAASPSAADAHGPRVIGDVAVLRTLLAKDSVTTAYLLGDLHPAYAEYCTWYVDGPSEALEAVLLLFTGLRAPVAIAYGQAAALDRIVARFASELPGRLIVHLQPHHLAAIDRHFTSDGLHPMLRMGLHRGAFTPAEDAGAALPVERLTHRDTADIVALQQFYPDSFFEPAQLDTGHYYGVRAPAEGDGRGHLVSVAGVHVVSLEDGVGVLGNIVTHPEHRGQGLSTRCTSHLCQRLMDEGADVLALNVERRNRSAVRVYEKLGFRYHDTYLEGWVERAAWAPSAA